VLVICLPDLDLITIMLHCDLIMLICAWAMLVVLLWVVGSHGWPVVWYGMELLAPRSTTTHLPFVLLWMDVMMVA
jgi:hypothetical protein